MLAVRGRLQRTTGQTAVAQQALEDAASLVSETDPRLAVELLSESVTAGFEAGQFEEASRAAARMADLAEHSTETARFLADLAYGGLAWRRGDAEHGMRLISRAASALEANPETSDRSGRLLDVAAAWCGIGNLDRARQYAERAVDLARREGAVGRLPDALQWAAGDRGLGDRTSVLLCPARPDRGVCPVWRSRPGPGAASAVSGPGARRSPTTSRTCRSMPGNRRGQ